MCLIGLVVLEVELSSQLGYQMVIGLTIGTWLGRADCVTTPRCVGHILGTHIQRNLLYYVAYRMFASVQKDFLHGRQNVADFCPGAFGQRIARR